ncbi:unnamed protein product [Amoebophrya sp. A120]|nr:unnamed protein product [Amoebophrya sp. A120]|eukprot:GSA120T00000355001.1
MSSKIDLIPPPRPEWIPSEFIRTLPLEWAQRMARRPPNCMLTQAGGSAFPPCGSEKACNDQLFLLQYLREKALTAMQDLEQTKLGLRIAKTGYVKAIARLAKMQQIPEGYLSEEDIANYNIHNLNHRIHDVAPLKRGFPGGEGKNIERAWNTLEDFELEIDRQRRAAIGGINIKERRDEERKGSFRFLFEGPPLMNDTNPHHQPDKFLPRLHLTPDLDAGQHGGSNVKGLSSLHEDPDANKQLNGYGNIPGFF